MKFRHAIRLGDWDLSTIEDCFQGQNEKEVCAPPYISASPEKIIVHPTYNVESVTADDIALIRLNLTIDFAKARGI